MALDLVTGYKGQAHITAEDVGAFNVGLFGLADFVLCTGEKFKATLIDNNTVKILDGDLIIQGRHVTQKKGSYDEVKIENGEEGLNRNDLIVARYTKTLSENAMGFENVAFAVKQGVAEAGTAADPVCATGDLIGGNCDLYEMPLYRVKLTGLDVSSPEPLFEVRGTEKEGITTIVQGAYWGNNSTIGSERQQVNLGFTPSGVIAAREGDFAFRDPSSNVNEICSAAIAVKGYPTRNECIKIETDGFSIRSHSYSGSLSKMNENNIRYNFLAWA